MVLNDYFGKKKKKAHIYFPSQQILCDWFMLKSFISQKAQVPDSLSKAFDVLPTCAQWIFIFLFKWLTYKT